MKNNNRKRDISDEIMMFPIHCNENKVKDYLNKKKLRFITLRVRYGQIIRCS